jgi:hypothetical protein
MNWEGRSWPSVREVVLHEYTDFGKVPSSAFPNLQTLKLLHFHGLNLDLVCPLLSIHGGNITSLSLPHLFGEWRYFEELQEVFNHSCPNLTELMFNMERPDSMWDPAVNYVLPPCHIGIPGIRVLGVRSGHEAFTELFWSAFLSEVLKLAAFFPNARTIRFYDEENVRYLQKCPRALRSFLEDCEPRNILVQDHLERPLSCRTYRQALYQRT